MITLAQVSRLRSLSWTGFTHSPLRRCSTLRKGVSKERGCRRRLQSTLVAWSGFKGEEFPGPEDSISLLFLSLEIWTPSRRSSTSWQVDGLELHRFRIVLSSSVAARALKQVGIHYYLGSSVSYRWSLSSNRFTDSIGIFRKLRNRIFKEWEFAGWGSKPCWLREMA